STTNTVTSSLNPSVVNNSVTFTATVSAVAPGSGTPTGTVTFKDGTTPLATNSLAFGQATLTTSSLLAGSHSITAAYNGDASFNTSTNSPLTQTANKSPSATALTASTNPTVSGQPITFTATVTGTNGPPTAPVRSKDGTTPLATNSLVSGVAAYTNSTLSVGSHAMTAVYNGDATYNTSTNSPSLTNTVNKADTTISLVSSN